MLRFIPGLVVLVCLSACRTPAPPASATLPAGPLSAQVIAANLAWPAEIHRPFFTTIQAAGNRLTATGVVQYRSATDYRMSAITETGMIVFDVRAQGDGVEVRRAMPGLSTGIVQAIARDLSLVYRQPESLENLEIKDGTATLKYKSGDGLSFVHTFGPDGRLGNTEVDVGLFDKLEIDYHGFDPDGNYPAELTLRRPLRAYRLQVTLK